MKEPHNAVTPASPVTQVSLRCDSSGGHCNCGGGALLTRQRIFSRGCAGYKRRGVETGNDQSRFSSILAAHPLLERLARDVPAKLGSKPALLVWGMKDFAFRPGRGIPRGCGRRSPITCSSSCRMPGISSKRMPRVLSRRRSSSVSGRPQLPSVSAASSSPSLHSRPSTVEQPLSRF